MSVLVINNNSDSNKLEDQVFWFKADMRPHFKVGCEAYWDYHQQNFNSEEQEEFDVTQYKMKNKAYININKYD